MFFATFASFVSIGSCFYSSIIISYSYSPDDWAPDNFCSDPSKSLITLGLAARREDGFNLSGIFSNLEASIDPLPSELNALLPSRWLDVFKILEMTGSPSATSISVLTLCMYYFSIISLLTLESAGFFRMEVPTAIWKFAKFYDATSASLMVFKVRVLGSSILLRLSF